MKLNEEQRKKAEKSFETLRVCTNCGSGPFKVFDRLFELREFNEGDPTVSRASSLIPLLVMTCTNCGKLNLFNAVELGVVGSEKVVKDGKKRK